MRRWQSSQRPPRALRTAQLDNILLIPASALPEKARSQALASQLPAGEVLLVLPAAPAKPRMLLTTVATRFAAKGRHVALLP
jgi:hypothetical protein